MVSLSKSKAGDDNDKEKPHILKVWWIACRPHTLTASLAPIVVSYNTSLSVIDSIESNDDKSIFVFQTILWSLFCMMMQLGCNLHNDYSDFIKGADNEKRIGQARATQRGWLTPTQTCYASCCFLFVGLVVGIHFISIIHEEQSKDDSNLRTISMICIVITSIFCAFAYTGGWPLNYIGLGEFSIGYSGLGDLFVFLYFGLVATLTLPFIYISTCTTTKCLEQDYLSTTLWTLFPYAIQVAVFGVNIIVVNNLRDRFTDVSANKRTLAVRFGATFCRSEYVCNLIIAYTLVGYDWWIQNLQRDIDDFALLRLLPLLSLPIALKELKAIQTKDRGALNPHVGGGAKVQFLFCILLGIAVRLS